MYMPSAAQLLTYCTLYIHYPYMFTAVNFYEFKFKTNFRSTPKSRPNKVGLGYPSVRPQKVFPIPMKFGM